MKLNIKLLKEKAYEKRLSYVGLSEKSNVNLTSCSEIMRGVQANYRKSTLNKLSKALDIPYDDMFVKETKEVIVNNSNNNSNNTRVSNNNRIHILCRLVMKLDSIEKTINQLN